MNAHKYLAMVAALSLIGAVAVANAQAPAGGGLEHRFGRDSQS